jgi:D-glycero-D-manno-heptose 1,7-bisphosphate phosphatase
MINKLFENVVEKVYGGEFWIANNHNHCSKILYLYPHYQSSLHFHGIKSEKFYVVKGIVQIETVPVKIGRHYDIDGEIERHILMPNQSIDIPVNLAHRFTAIIDDTALLEISTFHDDWDSYRLDKSRELSTQEIKELNAYLLSTVKDKKTMKKAVFADRDGTLSKNNRSHKGAPYYVLAPDQLEWIDGGIELLEEFKEQGYMIFVITMQNCIKEGKITLDMAKTIMGKMMESNLIDNYKICQSVEETDESKALSKMQAIMQLSAQYDIDVTQSISIGDTHGDCLASKKASVGTIFQIVLPYGDPASPLADKTYKALIDLHADFVFNKITGGFIPEGV